MRELGVTRDVYTISREYLINVIRSLRNHIFFGAALKFHPHARMAFALLSLCVVCLQVSQPINGAKILGLFSTPNYSHQIVYQALMKALADRGHEITVISPQPLKEPHKNYNDIDQSFLYEIFVEDLETISMTMPSDHEFVNFVTHIITFLGNAMCEAQLKSPGLQQFLESYNSSFDIIIIERMPFLCWDGIVHRFGSPPTVAVISFLAPTWLQDAAGNPHNPSYMPNFVVSHTDRKTFWERLMSAYFYLEIVYTWLYWVIPLQDNTNREYLGADTPSTAESDRNFSLVLYHGDWSVGYPQPLLPYIVGLRGIHIEKTSRPLPEKIQHFIDGAENGVVFFSLGTNINTKRLPESATSMFLNTLEHLPQRVLLKWHTTDFKSEHKNILASTWFPQQDVLAHQNVKLFVTQCGIQSLQEAVYYSVPVLGIPFLREQKLNAQKIVNEGAGLYLDLEEITTQKLSETIGNILKDQRYKENIDRLSEIFKEEPQSSLELSVWWVEYVLRNHGTKHMRPTVLDLTWQQYLMIDILLLVLGAFFISGITAWFVVILKRNGYMFLTLRTT